MSLPRDSRKWEASVVADPCEMVDPVERQRVMPGQAPIAREGKASGPGEPPLAMAGLGEEGAAMLTSDCRSDTGSNRVSTFAVFSLFYQLRLLGCWPAVPREALLRLGRDLVQMGKSKQRWGDGGMWLDAGSAKRDTAAAQRNGSEIRATDCWFQKICGGHQPRNERYGASCNRRCKTERVVVLDW
jgi:hypothetical protein